MDQTQQLVRLIDTALRSGWTFDERPLANFVVNGAATSIAWNSLLPSGLQSFHTMSVNDLLFGDNLAFLIALTGATSHFDFATELILVVQAPVESRVPLLHDWIFEGGIDE